MRKLNRFVQRVALASVTLSAAAGVLAGTGNARYGNWGVDLSAMDKGVRPGDNFYSYANGNWLKTVVLPPDRPEVGTFADLRILNETRLHSIAASIDAKAVDQLTDEERKLRDLYNAFNDQDQINRAGLAPAKGDLGRIEHLTTRVQVASMMGHHLLNLDSPFAAFIVPNPKDSKRYMLWLGQSGLGMPDRDYYLKTDDIAMEKTRAAYKKHLAAVFTLAGLSNSAARARSVYSLEEKIAQVSWPEVDRNDIEKICNPMTVAELNAFAPGFQWDAYFKSMGLSENKGKSARILLIREKSAFPALAKVFVNTPLEAWRDYLTIRYLHTYAAYLPEAFDEEDFAFFGKVLQGTSERRPRSTRAAHLLDDSMGEALGKIYASQYFSADAKSKAMALVHNLLQAYGRAIAAVAWMTPATREYALYKLHHMDVRIGYPDHWRDYSSLVIKRDDLLGDVQRATAFNWNYSLTRIDQPVDRTDWGTPQTVNAGYDAQTNAILFPAGILQPPFFDPNADDAVNYGAIGAVIGHEIGHAFDTFGGKFDADGNLKNWWSEEDKKSFEARTTVLIEQYGDFEPLPGLHINGANTLGENIADDAGLEIALKAYHLSLGNREAPIIDGYTGDQRFYLSFAQSRRTKERDARLRQQVLSNVHSPESFRVIGTMRNQDEWYSAFDVKPGDKFYVAPERRVHLW